VAVIVPAAVLPPTTPFTLHVTAVLLVFVTVAINVVEFPSGTVPAVGDTVTAIWGGGGGCISPPKPCAHPPIQALAEIATINHKVSKWPSTKIGVVGRTYPPASLSEKRFAPGAVQ
jgi:hypothetical protein